VDGHEVLTVLVREITVKCEIYLSSDSGRRHKRQPAVGRLQAFTFSFPNASASRYGLDSYFIDYDAMIRAWHTPLEPHTTLHRSQAISPRRPRLAFG
jgi:hypothetical protein